jgi:hypothetical protein
MSSRLSHRLAVSALLLAVALALGAPPAQASTNFSALESLGAKVQTWLTGWLPRSAGTDAGGLTDPNGRGHLRLPVKGSPGGPIIKPACDNAGSTDPNGCPPPR